MKTATSKPDKAVGYVRVSSEEQSKEGVSLDAQSERIRAYAAMRGFDLTAIYREEGISAKIPLHKRPQGMKLVAALTKGRARHVVAVKLDRLFRNAADALAQTEAWDKAKSALHVLDMGGSAIDTASAMGRMFFTMAAAFAEMERNLTSERTKAALSHLKAGGQAYTHITPLGFTREGDRLVENEAEMQVVGIIQQRRAAGQSLAKIAAHLNSTDTPTKLGGKWHPVTIQSVLKVHRA